MNITILPRAASPAEEDALKSFKLSGSLAAATAYSWLVYYGRSVFYDDATRDLIAVFGSLIAVLFWFAYAKLACEMFFDVVVRKIKNLQFVAALLAVIVATGLCLALARIWDFEYGIFSAISVYLIYLALALPVMASLVIGFYGAKSNKIIYALLGVLMSAAEIVFISQYALLAAAFIGFFILMLINPGHKFLF